MGIDFGASDRLTLAIDILGVKVFDSPQLMMTDIFTGLDPEATRFPDIGFETPSFNETSGAIGFKMKPGANFLVNFNVLSRLDDNGLA